MKKPAFLLMSVIVFFVVGNSDGTLFLPLITHNYCFDTFAYDEPVLWNLLAIDVAPLWYRCGSKRGLGITVAIVDTGVDVNHPDLNANIVNGISFVQDSSDVDDNYGHGTHLAGIVAAAANNGGIIGVAPEASIMPVKVLDETGSGSAADVARGIEWATDHEAHIINLSIGSPVPSNVVEEAVAYANDAGALIVAAAGNCGGDDYLEKGCQQQHQLDYPGNYSTVIAVTSINAEQVISDFSSHGEHIELTAPGEEIYSTYLNEAYETLSGTSFAVAHVAGAAAIIWSEDVALSNAGVRLIFQNTATDLGESGVDSIFGYGLIDIDAALSETIHSTISTIDVVPIHDTESYVGSNLVQRAHKNGRQDNEFIVQPRAAFVPGEILVKVQPGGPSIAMLRNLLHEEITGATVQVEPVVTFSNIHLLHIQAGAEQIYLQALSAIDGIEYAELNYLYQVR